MKGLEGNIEALIAHTPLYVTLAILSGLVLPAVGALATKVPSFLTAVVNLIAAVITGVVATGMHAAATNAGFSWSSAFATSLLTAASTFVVHSKFYKDTTVEDTLHATGLKL